ncbi:methionine biosynthesis protein MetW [Thiomicrospira cyclica]|jgi:methionine biosynthesis protein MetW|uniref:Methionine biosynthesis protein MetW n=1 Tax=Thiomicrospira cyclica (strain DSM 14477 / JCM 11371 / ALM1) TaxID=717773 RepID=F6DAE3_THICA|nr:methionine biosynthesis protein MetW [Thiomicrospira cyclica]AEG31109.1 methionine biosynthesis protein MetW [Thiomicrospira cyclica ALM1]
MSLSPEFQSIANWIEPNTHVLDLGCGDGQLLQYLTDERQVRGYGMEIDPLKTVQAMHNGLNVIQSNLNSADLTDYFDPNSFDYVIMTQALQVVSRPDILLKKMLRVGRECIVTFPNFGHWRMRAQLLFKGRMPETDTLPYHWYDTPNIHLCTFKDFEKLCAELGIEIVARSVVNRHHQTHILMKAWPNGLGEVALYKIKARNP